MARVKIADLLPGTDYVVQVRAVRDGKNSRWSEKFNFVSIENSVLPKTPTNVTWFAQGTAFHGQWDKVNQQLDNDFAKVIRYDVELENSSGTLREVIAHPASDEPIQKFKLGEQKMTALFGQILTTVKMRVRAVTQNENKSAWSAVISASFAAPAPPTAAVVEEGVNFVKMSWTAPSDMTGVDGYRVYSGTTAGFTPSVANRIYQGQATTATFNSKVYTKRYFKIRSYSRFDVESTDLAAEGTPQNPSDPAIPVAPTGVTWVAVGDAFHGEWNQVTTGTLGETGVKIDRYEIEMTGDPGAVIAMASAPEVASGKPFFTLSYEENVARFIAAKANITMRVRAVTTFGIVGAWSAMTAAATNNPPSAPTGLAGTVNFEYIDLKWNAVSDADLVGYRVYLSTTGAAGTYNQIYQGGALNYSFPSAMYTTDHHFQVKAYDTFGLESAASNTVGPLRPKSSFEVDTIAPPLPTALAMTISNGANGGPGSGNITWTMSSPPADLAGFTVKWRKVGATNWQSTTVDKDSRSVEVLLENPYVNYETQVRAFDGSANYSAYTSSATGTAGANTAPSTPASPNAASSTMRIQVTPTGTKAAGGAMEADVSSYEVYASTTTGFTTYDSTTMLGVIEVGPAMTTAFPVPASGGGTTQTWYVKVIAVDSEGLKSAASAQTTATPALIDSANIVDASITNAKIQNLGVDKLVAGTGLAASFTIKSTLTLGDASTTGFIQSENWNGVDTGWQLTKSGLTIFNGDIKASSITLTPAWADSVGATMTTIDGGIIKTGSIQSQTNTTINGVSVPLWSIPTNGSATFANLTVRGLSIVGTAGDAGAPNRSAIQSANYNGTVGWKIDANGDAYFASGTFKGDISAATGTFQGNISGSAATVTGTITGNTYQTSAASTYVTRITSTTFKIIGADAANPLLDFSTSANLLTIGANAVFKGSLSGATGTFSGTVDIGPTADRVSIRNNGTTGVIDFYDGGSAVGSIYGFSSGITISGNTQVLGTLTPSHLTTASGGRVTANYFSSPTSLMVLEKAVQFDLGTTFNGAANNFFGAVHMNNNNINSVAQITASTIAGDPVFSHMVTGTGGTQYAVVGNAGRISKQATAPSDERLKENLSTLDDDKIASLVLQVEPFQFTWKGYGNPDIGFMANRIGDLGPELDRFISRDERDGHGTGVNYPMWVVAQQSALRMHQRQIKELRERIEILEAGA